MLRKYILDGDFNNAYSMSKELSVTKLENELSIIAFDEESIQVYLYCLFLIDKNETDSIHKIASIILSQALSFLPGAYFAATYHAKRAVEINESIQNIEYLLFFHSIPDETLSIEEVKKYSNKLLELDKDNIIATKILNNL